MKFELLSNRIKNELEKVLNLVLETFDMRNEPLS